MPMPADFPPENADRPDAALAALLLSAPAADAAGPAVVARSRRRLLQRIAQAETRLVTVPPGDDGFAPFAPGIRIKLLHGAGERLSYLLQLAPGAAIPPHRHPVDEACVVLQGALQIGNAHRVAAGGFHLAPAGSLHAAVASEGGALIFLHGAVPAFEDLL